MKKIIGSLFFALVVTMNAQTLPTLPVVNVITNGTTTCTFEVVNSTGGVSSQCKLIADGTILENAVYQATEQGSTPGTAEVGCILWKTTDAKYRLQCAALNKLVIDGYLPTDIIRKPRWYRFLF